MVIAVAKSVGLNVDTAVDIAAAADIAADSAVAVAAYIFHGCRSGYCGGHGYRRGCCRGYYRGCCRRRCHGSHHGDYGGTPRVAEVSAVANHKNIVTLGEDL